jgi:chitodextrinase
VSGLIAGTTYYFAVAAYDTNGLESALSAEIHYVVPTTPPPPPKIPSPTLQVTITSAKQVVLTGQAPAGYTYDVLASPTLTAAFTVVGSVTADATGAFTFIDPTSATNRVSYYRLLLSGVPANMRATLQLAITAARQVVLTGKAPAGYTYDVLTGPTPASALSVIGSVTADATGAYTFTDPTASATNRVSCYRLGQSAP